MNETVITPGMKRRELRIFLVCFIVAFVINVVGIIKYSSPALELISQLHTVLFVSMIIYLLAAIFRGLFFLISHIWKK
jgi:hypothetical protein